MGEYVRLYDKNKNRQARISSGNNTMKCSVRQPSKP